MNTPAKTYTLTDLRGEQVKQFDNVHLAEQTGYSKFGIGKFRVTTRDCPPDITVAQKIALRERWGK